jgi:hypothetical protein
MGFITLVHVSKSCSHGLASKNPAAAAAWLVSPHQRAIIDR